MSDTAIEVAGRIELAEGNPVVNDYGRVIELANFMCFHSMSFGHQPAAAAGAIAYGLSLGKGPYWSLKNIAMVRDKPTIWGEGLKGLATERAYCGGFLSGCYSGVEIGVFLGEKFDRESRGDEMRRELQRALRMRAASVGEKAMRSPDYLCGWSVSKHLDQDIVAVSLFDMTDATMAGLSGGNMYRKWPRRMLMHRAFGFLVKDFYPEVMVGEMTTEEAMQEAEIADRVSSAPATVTRSVEDLVPDEPVDVDYQEQPPVDEAPPEVSVGDIESSLKDRLGAVRSRIEVGGKDPLEYYKSISGGRGWSDMTATEKAAVVERAEADWPA